MRMLIRIALWIAGGFAMLLLLAVAAWAIVFPRAADPEPEPFARTAERMDRGRYLVENVATCLDCHSQRDWTRFSGPPVAETRGGGARLEFLGSDVQSANITPGALAGWTDGEIARAIAGGVSRDGRALDPMMPYDTFAGFTREDLESVVIYLRTLPAVDHEVPPVRSDLLSRVVGRVLPKPYEPPAPPDEADTVARGAYLVRLAECGYCHRGNFGGGGRFHVPGGKEVTSANITPRKGGINGMDRERFIGRFKAFAAPEVLEGRVAEGGSNTVMPWVRFSGMTEEDLGAIFDFLVTVPLVPRPAKPAAK